MLDLEDPAASGDVISPAAPATSARMEGDVAVLTLPLIARRPSSFEADFAVTSMTGDLRLQSFGECMVRACVDCGFPRKAAPREDLDSSLMIERDDALQAEPLVILPGIEAGQ